MAKKPDPGVEARYQDRLIQFSHVNADPVVPFVLTADPWAHLTSWLYREEASAAKKKQEPFQRARYYCDLAEAFYRSADSAELPVKGTLVYYGFLNLVKVLLCLRGVNVGLTEEAHGLYLPSKLTHTVGVYGPNPKKLNIFHEFARVLGQPVTIAQNLSLEDIASNIPEIHEICYSCGKVPGGTRRFLPVEIQIRQSSTSKMVFTTVRYKSSQRSIIPTSKLGSSPWTSYFYDEEEVDGWIYHRAVQRRTFNDGSFPVVYRRLCAEYQKLHLASILTNLGYRHYFNLEAPPFHHLSYVLTLAFYVGSAARYRPGETISLLREAWRPVVSEAMTVLPRQFLYQMVSLVTARPCVVPHAMI